MAGESANFVAQIRDLEEKQRLLKERVLLLGKTLLDEREKYGNDILDLKKQLVTLKEEHQRTKEVVGRLIERSDLFARKEELNILAKQFDLFRER